MLALQVSTDEGVPLVPPVIDQIVRRNTDGLVLRTDGWTKFRYFPCKYGIRRFIVVLGRWDYRMVAQNGSACCIPPVRGVWRMEPWRLDWTARAWIIGEESYGTLVSWVNHAYTCVMIASVRSIR